MVTGRSGLDLVRKAIGATVLSLIVASIFGVVGVAPPFASLLVGPIVANAAVVFADNVSTVTTSRDGAPFNGNIWFNNTVLVNITFKIS